MSSVGIVLSHFQATILLKARETNDTSVRVSLDLGLSIADVLLDVDGVVFPNRQRLSWSNIMIIQQDDVGCYTIDADDTLHKIQQYSDDLDRFCSLMPTEGAPTLLIAGFIMHRVKSVDPHEDTQRKIRAIGSLRGQVLDTSTGLGYTAIAAAQTAEHVITIELDPTVLEIAHYNPWSRQLFERPNIEQRIGDSFEQVRLLEDSRFSRIIHDPPAFSLAGELYSGAFYRQLFRILKPGGRLFHYIGDLESKSGSGVTRGVVRRLQEAGFTRIKRRPDAFGLVASGS